MSGAVSLMCAAAIAGCAAQPKPVSDATDGEASRAVTRALAHELLANRENVTRAPTEREVEAVVRRHVVSASCRQQDDGRFGCRVHWRGFPASGCTATVRDGRASNLRCGSAPAPPRVQRRFVDCSEVGRARTVSDPRGDTFSLVPGNPPPHVDAPRADVTSIVVSATDRELCADFTLAAPPSPRTAITFFAGRRTETQTPSESLSASIVLDPRRPGVSTLDHGWVSAQVGTDGDRVSLVIDARALTPALGYLFTDGFRFHAHASEARRGQDEAPPGVAWATYP